MSATNENLTSKAQDLAARREPFVRATVVRAQHPTSAHAGDTALVLADGRMDGFVGGNCVEASVREHALRALVSREPLLLRIVPGEVSGVPEEGAIEVSNPCLSGGSIDVFLEPQVPAPRVLIVGTTPIARAVAQLGADLGFDMDLADGEAGAVHPDDLALIVASHGSGEEPALTAGLRAGVPYIALVASKTRGAAVLASLDVDEDQRARVHSPAGLDLGAHTPAEIALSILAELVLEKSMRNSNSPAEPAATVPTATDPVCGMTVVAVDSTLHVERDGVTYYFCSAGCRTTFLADPERYALAS